MNEEVLKRSSVYLKDWLRFRYEKGILPGFVVAVAHNGKIIFNEGYGYANLKTKEKMTPKHIFRIASHSKTFTATALMQLQEKRKLSINDPVIKYLPWLTKHKDKRWKQVTIRQLMSHGAGVIRDGLDSDYWQGERPFPNEAQFKREILEAELVLKPNLKMKYSNCGFALLGLVIASVSGQSYNDYVTENIIKPLGLKNTTPEFNSQMSTRMVVGYTTPDPNKKRLPIGNINTRATSAAAGFCSTSEDMCKYFTAHFPRSGKLLSDKSKKDMQQGEWKVENVKEKEKYGLGLELELENKRWWPGHGGGFPGHNTKSLFHTRSGLVVIVLTNALKGGAGDIAHSVIKVIDYFQANPSKGKNDLAKFEGRYVSLWSLIDILAMKDKLIGSDPGSWDSFESPEELKQISNNKFRVIKTDSFSPIGELVHFEFDKSGKVKSVVFAGETLLPEKDYLAKLAKKKSIDFK